MYVERYELERLETTGGILQQTADRSDNLLLCHQAGSTGQCYLLNTLHTGCGVRDIMDHRPFKALLSSITLLRRLQSWALTKCRTTGGWVVTPTSSHPKFLVVVCCFCLHLFWFGWSAGLSLPGNRDVNPALCMPERALVRMVYSGTSLQRDFEKQHDSQQQPSFLSENIFYNRK